MGVINALKNIIDSISFFTSYITNLIKATVQGLELVTDSLSFPLAISGFFPTVIASGMIAVILASVIKFIFGRL